MGLLERIGALCGRAVSAAESELDVPVESRAWRAREIEALVSAYGAALEAKVVESREAGWLPPYDRGSVVDDGAEDVDRSLPDGLEAAAAAGAGAGEFRVELVIEEGENSRVVEKVLTVGSRDEALEIARALWPGAADVRVAEE